MCGWWRATDPGAGNDPERLAEDREALLKEIDAEMRMTAGLTGRRALTPAVREAMARVPREAFVSASEQAIAYLNQPLSIGCGQTISQPFIVALMTEFLDPKPDGAILEVGTGCGYQAAVLSRLVHRVYTIEVIAELAASASERLSRLGYDNVEVRHGDGAAGWLEHAPFDGIIVTAAAAAIPTALVEQLAPDAPMVIPVCDGFLGGQTLTVLRKDAEGRVERDDLLPVAFVPLV